MRTLLIVSIVCLLVAPVQARWVGPPQQLADMIP